MLRVVPIGDVVRQTALTLTNALVCDGNVCQSRNALGLGGCRASSDNCDTYSCSAYCAAHSGEFLVCKCSLKRRHRNLAKLSKWMEP
jgi:hypothetical protein